LFFRVNLVKTGAPSRAEITDATMGERAEGVMLNKGPHLVQAVHVLDDIPCPMETHQSKKSARLRPRIPGSDDTRWDCLGIWRKFRRHATYIAGRGLPVFHGHCRRVYLAQSSSRSINYGHEVDGLRVQRCAGSPVN
jgi:hypothetical protein